MNKITEIKKALDVQNKMRNKREIKGGTDETEMIREQFRMEIACQAKFFRIYSIGNNCTLYLSKLVSCPSKINFG